MHYFNVFGRRQDPFGAYAAVIPHSLADISEAHTLLGYGSQFDIRSGLKKAAGCYWDDLRK